MSTATMFEPVVALADAVLFERDPLDPAHAASRAGPFGRPAGILAPAGCNGGEPSWMQTECLLGPTLAGLDARLRFLQPITGEKGVVRELDFAIDLRAAFRGEQCVPFEMEAGRRAGERGQFAAWSSVRGLVRIRAEVLPTRPRSVRVRVRVENRSAWQEVGARRETVSWRSCMMAPHLLLHAASGRFLSLIDPPSWAERAAEACHNVRTFPVLAGPADHDDLMLSAPVVLYDHPELEPATDRSERSQEGESVSLRVLLTRKFGPGAADVVDGADTLPPELLARLRRAIRRMHVADLVPWDGA